MKNKKKYRHSFDRLRFYTRWRYSKYVGLRIDSSDWTMYVDGVYLVLKANSHDDTKNTNF